MDLRHMRHFVAVAEELHFGRAAQRLNMAQPPVSQSIRRLEANLGVDLFIRGKGGVSVTLTPAGKVFLVQARRALMQAEFARKMAQRAAAGVANVRISFVGPALYRVLPELLVHFRELEPTTELQLFERPSPEQITGVFAGEFDVGIVIGGIYALDGLEQQAIERKPYLAAIPSDWPLAGQSSVTMAELADHPMIRPPQKYMQGSATPDLIASFGLVPRVTQEAAQVNTAISLVGAGLGCSIIMGIAAQSPARNVAFLPISDLPGASRSELTMIWQPDQGNDSAARFVEAVRAYVAATPALLDDAIDLG